MFMEVNEKFIQEIIDLATRQPWALAKVLQKNPKYSHLNAYILEWTKDMPDIMYCARIFYTIHKMTTYMKCANPNCSNELCHDLKFKPLSGPRSTHCCPSCAQKDPNVRENARRKLIERCGYASSQ